MMVIFRKERSCFIDTFLADVNTCHFTPLFCEGEQVASLATTYFQYTGVRCLFEVCTQVFHTECPCSVG